MFGKTKVRKSLAASWNYLGCVILLLTVLSLKGQDQGSLKVYWHGLPEAYEYEAFYTDSLAASLGLRMRVDELRIAGFLTAQYRVLSQTDSLWQVLVSAGEKFAYSQVRIGEEWEPLLRQVGINRNQFGMEQSPYTLASAIKRIQQHLINQGYPFTAVRLDSLEIEDHALKARLEIDKGPLVRFDSLVIEPSDLVKPSFLASYLGIPSGTPFSEEVFRRMERRLGRLTYLRLAGPIQVRFVEDRAYPRLLLEARKVNEIDGVLGLLPNELEPGKVLLTGRLQLDLHNLFQSGKRLYLQWQQMRPETQTLDFRYEHPALFGSQLEAYTDFSILRETDDFLNIRFQAGMRYFIGNKSRFGFVTGNQRGTVPGINFSPELPSIPVDMRYTFYGLTYDFDNRDDPFHPFRGFLLQMDARLGNRSILDPGVVEQNSLERQSIKTEWGLLAEAYHGLWPRVILKAALQGGMVLNERLFANELLRVGGLQRLRGFNENFFFASGFGLVTLESRFYLDPNSFFFLFYDQSVLQVQRQADTFVTYPFGAGAGISFTTEAGIFNLAFALGRSQTQPFDFQNAKVHIGYISRF